MDLLAELKSRTRPHHDRIEAAVDVMKPGLTRADYAAVLGRFRGFYAAWEDRAAAALPPDLRAEFDRRRKLPALDRDLRFLGVDPDSLPRCDALPATDSTAAVLGSMYVVEGSTLGGQVISRHLEAALGVAPGAGGDFFAGYGEQTGERWKAFRAWLAEKGAGREDEVIAAAADTFDKLREWMAGGA
jgi:heme oxygenase